MRVAAIDLGTNTFLLLIAEVEGGGGVRVLHDEAQVIRLGQDVNRTKRLHPEALARAEVCFAEFAKTIGRHQVDKILACATSAARDVENGAELIRLAEKYQIPVRIISGEEEAELTFQGTIDGESEDPVLIIDVGGGSTEFIVGQGGLIRSRVSLNIGAVRMTEMFVTRHPIPPSEFESMKTFVRAQIASVAKLKELLTPGARYLAVAGTPTTLVALEQGLPFDAGRVHGFKLTPTMLSSWIERLADLSVAERQKLAGMEAKRADVIVAGALILQLSAAAFGDQALEVSIRGLRYGIARKLGASK